MEHRVYKMVEAKPFKSWHNGVDWTEFQSKLELKAKLFWSKIWSNLQKIGNNIISYRLSIINKKVQLNGKLAQP